MGAAGYTAGELLRILVNHPAAEVVFAQSGSHAGEPVWAAHKDLLGETDLVFCAEAPVQEVDVIFLCSGHGKAKPFMEKLGGSYKGAVIDLGNDFRLKADAEDFVYGLPEAFRKDIVKARHIANPGCFATSIQLALLPIAAADKLPEVHITGITGSTGAGQSPSATTHFSWRANNLSVYKAFSHQHEGEISETLHALAPSWEGGLNFVPVRGDFQRGILASVHFDCPLGEEEAVALYKDFYKDEPFVHVIDGNPDLKMVTGTNKCVLNVRKHGSKLHVISVIDNLVKGASGQAVENMNLVFGLPEKMGLNLKGVAF